MDQVLHVEAFSDNYIWLIVRAGAAAIVDAGDEEPVFRALEAGGFAPAAVLCTHHHWDHTGANRDLLARYDLPVYGPAAERIPGCSRALADGDHVRLSELDLELAVLAVPGHTRGHIAYYGEGMLFCGDTLFSAGCGRLFEGSAEEMYASLQRLAALPDETLIYCAHEYTAANLRFAAAVEPDNPAVRRRAAEVARLRAAGRPSLPSPLGAEKTFNPFLRCHVPAVRAAAETHAGRPLASPVEVFRVLRAWKDRFA